MLVLGMPTSVSNFYPRSPCGERRSRSGLVLRQSHFYPRSPCGERHLLCMPLWWLSHFYPRSPCGERRCVAQAHGGAQWNFYPRSPCGERRTRGPTPAPISAFLSTLSLRRATRLLPVPQAWQPNFYPRSPCGERRRIPVNIMLLLDFYPRSPCGERPEAIKPS